MFKFASISVPGGRRVARVALAGVLLATAGAALGSDNRPGGHGGGSGAPSRGGMSRMMSMGTHSMGATHMSGWFGGGASRMMMSTGRSASSISHMQGGMMRGAQVRSQPQQGGGMPGYAPRGQAAQAQPQGMLSPQRYSGGAPMQARSAPAPQSMAASGQAPQAMSMQGVPGARGTPQAASQSVSRSPFSRMAMSGHQTGSVSSAPGGQSFAAAAGNSGAVNGGRPLGETSMFRTFSPAHSSGAPGAVGASAVGVSSGHWHSGGDWHGSGWHGGDWHGGGWHNDGHGHDDHWHFTLALGWFPYYYPSYGYWGWPYPYSSWCYPTYWGGGYYNPVSYAMAYPTYPAMDYGTGSTINNYYYTSPTGDPSAPGAMSSAPGPVYADVGGFKPQPPAEDTATVYRSLANHGQMAWSDTATSIINSMVAAPADHRAAVAKQYLGRTPVGAWEVTLEGRQDIDNATELTCRGTGTTTTGGRPTIIVRVNHKVDALTPGQRLSVTGRLVEMSVDDSSNPGGVLVLEDADVSW